MPNQENPFSFSDLKTHADSVYLALERIGRRIDKAKLSKAALNREFEKGLSLVSAFESKASHGLKNLERELSRSKQGFEQIHKTIRSLGTSFNPIGTKISVLNKGLEENISKTNRAIHGFKQFQASLSNIKGNTSSSASNHNLSTKRNNDKGASITGNNSAATAAIDLFRSLKGSFDIGLNSIRQVNDIFRNDNVTFAEKLSEFGQGLGSFLKAVPIKEVQAVGEVIEVIGGLLEGLGRDLFGISDEVKQRRVFEDRLSLEKNQTDLLNTQVNTLKQLSRYGKDSLDTAKEQLQALKDLQKSDRKNIITIDGKSIDLSKKSSEDLNQILFSSQGTVDYYERKIKEYERIIEDRGVLDQFFNNTLTGSDQENVALKWYQDRLTETKSLLEGISGELNLRFQIDQESQRAFSENLSNISLDAENDLIKLRLSGLDKEDEKYRQLQLRGIRDQISILETV